MQPLTRIEAAERARLLTVRGYTVDLDLTRGEETFGSTARIRFDCVEPLASTFLDLTAAAVREVVLNGTPVELSSALTDGRVRLDDLAAENEVMVVADCKYSHTGEGFHRFVDPADGEVYTWTQTFLFNANRVFACFDQPDLKAPLQLRVRAPESWIVLSNGAATRVEPGTWKFATTPPLATYVMAVVAGPYHSAVGRYGTTPMGVHCRRSLAEDLDADEILDITRRSFEFFERIFGIPYPYGKYDQAFVPGVSGAMENAACVTFGDDFIYRSRVTGAERQSRARTIAHELAHMWFGDLVTMRWWDDLWLNESFAEYMGTLAIAEATHFRTAWTTFCATTKAWGYRQDQLPTTHPISGDAPDTDAAGLNFDGISYAKGAGVLRQLAAWTGFESFAEGLHAYLNEHAHGNSSLADLLAALERSSGRDLEAWSREWLQTAGLNQLCPESAVDADGAYRSFAVVQTAPEDHPTLRSHRLAIGLYDRSGDRLVRRERLEVDIAGGRTDIPALVGVMAPDLLLLNDQDLTWAKVRLDHRSLATALDGWLTRIDESLPRALLWASLWDMTRDAELPAGGYLSVVIDAVAGESEVGLVEDVLGRARQAIDRFGRPEERRVRLGLVASRCRQLLEAAEPGGDLQLAYATGYISTVLESTDVGRVRGWLEGRDAPDGLAFDPELRWLILQRLAVVGAIGEAAIASEQERDRTSTGEAAAATARAGLPDPEAKAAAWAAIMEPDRLSQQMLSATVRGFWQTEQLDLCERYVDPYLAALPEIWRTRTWGVAGTITLGLYPSKLVARETLERTDRALEGGLDDRLRRVLIEQRADLARALGARAVDTE